MKTLAYKNIYLIGMPGVGKSYWADQLALKHGLQCIDLDHIIAIRTGMSIAAFFERYGEEEFRRLEALTLEQVSKVFPHNTVIACGGGTPCFQNNLGKMQEQGIVVYLESSLAYLMANLDKESPAQRPLVPSAHREAYLEQLLEKRQSFYQKAQLILAAEYLKVADFEPALHGLN